MRYFVDFERRCMIQTEEEKGYATVDEAWQAGREDALRRIEKSSTVVQNERYVLVDIVMRRLPFRKE